MPQLSTAYQPGSVTTATDGGPAGADGGMGPAIQALIAAKLAAAMKAAQPAPKRVTAGLGGGAPMRAMAMDRLGGGGMEQATQNRPIEHPWYTYQGAATRPVGLSPGMVPGMQADPNLLPPWMRPQQSNTEYAPSVQAGARRGAISDLTFDAKLAGDRARTANGNFEF